MIVDNFFFINFKEKIDSISSRTLKNLIFRRNFKFYAYPETSSNQGIVWKIT